MKDYNSNHKDFKEDMLYAKELKSLFCGKDNLLDIVHRHFGRYFTLAEKDVYKTIGNIQRELGLFFTFCMNYGIISNYLITINPQIISLSTKLSFIQIFYQWVFIDEDGKEKIVFDTIFCINPSDINQALLERECNK